MNYPTWSDLSKESIVPPLGARQAPDIGPVAVMVSTEPDLKSIRSFQANLKSSLFFMGHLLTLENRVTVAGPFIGSPYGVMLLESLIAKGAAQIIVLGWCGALSQDLQPGDLIVPKKAICDEGTSRHYRDSGTGMVDSLPDEDLSNRLICHIKAEGLCVSRFPVWTTDAIYRETREKVDFFTGRGARAVEMECSALFSVAAYRNIPIAALLVVSDSLAKTDWSPGFRKKKFKQARAFAQRAVLSFADGLSTPIIEK